MLEDYTMEKKPSSRSVQAPVKGCGTEVKKAQDATSNAGKQFPRQSRRREPPGSKLDQYKKSGPQKQNKSGYYDNKKPKPRGQFYYGCGKANTQVVDELTEQFGLVATSTNVGSKKQSLNHLLNFHYAPRGEHLMTSSSPYHWPTSTGGSIGGSGGHYYNSGRWLTSTQKHKYNKEQFLQANCQFVVRSDGDYTAYMSDPDLLVDWDMIEQIRVFSSEAVNCPICLSTPVAGKITRCGHVFCWSCMLHYLALSDKSWRKCPICYESVHRQDLKSVLVLLRTTYTLGEEITFRLMKRKRGSLIASPVPQYDARTLQGLLSINEDKLDVKYSKLLTANNDEVFAIIDKEMAELNEQMTENEGCPELCFIEQAIQLLKERKEALSTRVTVVNDNGKNIDGLNNTTAMSADTELSSQETKQSSSSSSFDSDKDNVGDAFNNNINATALDNTNENNKPQDSNSPMPIWFNKVDTDNTNTHDNYISNAALDSEVDSQFTSPTTPDYEQLESFEIYDEMEAAGIRVDDEVTTEDSGTERCRYVSASSTSEGEENAGSHITTIVAEDLEISTCEPTNSRSPVKHFFFYQALDGQQIFLHAVNVRMLEMTYGSLEFSPPVIKGKILEKESGSMTDVLRKRLRYLQHLPVTCQFEVAEIDLKPPIITTDTLDSFREQLETRRRRRDKRARDERRRERKVTEQVHRQYGRGPTPRLRIESLQHFPQCGSDLACSPPSNNPPIGYNNNYVQDGGNQTVPIRSSSPTSSRASSPVSVLSSSPNSSSTSLSFAQMLRDGKSTGGGWVTQQKKSQPASVCTSKPLQYDSDDNSLAAPQYRQSFSDAIATAFEKAALMHEKDEPVSSGGKKKKKKQKVLLFATGMACNSK